MPARPDLEILQVWCVSTSHLQEHDCELLADTDRLVVQDYAEGFWVAVPYGDEIPEYLDTLQAHGFSRALGLILSIAVSHNVDYLKIDADAPIYSFLPQFHW